MGGGGDDLAAAWRVGAAKAVGVEEDGSAVVGFDDALEVGNKGAVGALQGVVSAPVAPADSALTPAFGDEEVVGFGAARACEVYGPIFGVVEADAVEGFELHRDILFGCLVDSEFDGSFGEEFEGVDEVGGNGEVAEHDGDLCAAEDDAICASGTQDIEDASHEPGFGETVLPGHDGVDSVIKLVAEAAGFVGEGFVGDAERLEAFDVNAREAESGQAHALPATALNLGDGEVDHGEDGATGTLFDLVFYKMSGI